VRVPLVPTTVAEYDPTEPLHDSVDVLDVPSVTLTGDRVHDSPVAGAMLRVRFTFPVNPLVLCTLTIALPVAVALTVIEVGAETEKS
jgi:hypothetical protein